MADRDAVFFLSVGIVGPAHIGLKSSTLSLGLNLGGSEFFDILLVHLLSMGSCHILIRRGMSLLPGAKVQGAWSPLVDFFIPAMLMKLDFSG